MQQRCGVKGSGLRGLLKGVWDEPGPHPPRHPSLLAPKYGIYKTVKAKFRPWPSGGVSREQNMLKGHLPRVMYHQVYKYTKIQLLKVFPLRSEAAWAREV